MTKALAAVPDEITVETLYAMLVEQQAMLIEIRDGVIAIKDAAEGFVENARPVVEEIRPLVEKLEKHPMVRMLTGGKQK